MYDYVHVFSLNTFIIQSLHLQIQTSVHIIFLVFYLYVISFDN